MTTNNSLSTVNTTALSNANHTPAGNQQQVASANTHASGTTNSGQCITKEREVINHLIDHSEVFIDQLGQFFIIFSKLSGKTQRFGVDTAEFNALCSRLLHERTIGVSVNKRMVKDTVEGFESALCVEVERGRVTVIKSALRNAQTGVVDEHSARLYWDLANDAGESIVITPGKWEVLADCNDVFFTAGIGAAEIQVPPNIGFASIDPALAKLWDNVLVPKAMRMAYLGQLINNFFTDDHQPMMVFYSPDPGQTGKTPTAENTRQILDPQTSPISAAPDEVNSLIRMIAANRTVVLDDATVENLPKKMQKRLDTYSINGTDTLKKLYSSAGVITVDPRGITVMTTNEENLLIATTTRSRSVVYRFEQMMPGRAKVASKAKADFNQDLNEIRGALLTLVAEVLAEVPGIADGVGGHRFKMYSRIVDCLHKLLKVPGSMAQTLVQTQSRAESVEEAVTDDELLVFDLGTLVHKEGKIDKVSATKLYSYLTQLNQNNPVAIKERERSSRYPGSHKELLHLLQDQHLQDRLEDGCIKLTAAYCKKNKCQQFTLGSLDDSMTENLYAGLVSLTV